MVSKTQWLSVVGILPSRESVGPRGLHLRWAFPPSLGFPTKGFEIYRRESEKKVAHQCTEFSDLAKHQQMPNPWAREGLIACTDANASLEGTGGQLLNVSAPGKLQLHFTEPVVRVRLQIAGVRQSLRARAFLRRRQVAQSALVPPQAGPCDLVMQASLISSVEIELGFRSLLDVCFTTSQAFCESDWGRPIKRLPLVASVANALKRLPLGLHNFYADSRDEAVDQHGGQIEAMIDWLHRLQEPASTAFVNPGASPDQLQLDLSAHADAPLKVLQPQSMILLASLNPNLAQMLGLYWVDRFEVSNGPQPGVPYDYKVEGRWRDQHLCGVILGVGKREAALPQVPGPVTLQQMPGIQWPEGAPLGRVQVTWPDSGALPAEENIAQAIFFDITRENVTLATSERLNAKQPLLKNSSAGSQSYEDRSVPVGSMSLTNSGLALFDFRYHIRGIDIFGQAGRALASPRLQMRDLAAPPPPVRLYARLQHPGEPWRGLITQHMLADADQRTAAIVKLFGPGTEWIAQAYDGPCAVDLRFEYGASQHHQAPDARAFHVYWRHDSLRHAVPLEILSATPLHAGRTTEVQVAADGQLNRFEGGWITNVDPFPTGSDIAVDDRERRVIIQATGPDTIEVDGDFDPTSGQAYWMVADPHHRDGWEWTGRRVDVQAPLQAEATASRAVTVEGTVWITDPGAEAPPLLQPGPGRPDPSARPPRMTEILLNIELLDTNLFEGGSVRVDGAAPVPVVYSTAGLSSNKVPEEDKLGAARIAIPVDDHLQRGQQVKLVLEAAEPDAERGGVFQVTLDNAYVSDDISPSGIAGEFARRGAGGELTWAETVDGKDLLRRARLVSSSTRSGGRTSFLVQSGYADLPDRLDKRRCRYYAAYHLRLLIDAGASPTGDLKLPISPAAGSRQVFFALLASDRGQIVDLDESTRTVDYGPLSAPAQVTALRPPLMPVPEAPLPCAADFDGTVMEGFATPPDQRGRATVCLKWRLPPSAPQGPIQFEIGRALDATIVAAVKRAWLRGDLSGAPQLQHDSMVLSGPISVLANTTGPSRYRTLRMQTTTDGVNRRALIGGRIVQAGWVARVVQAVIDRDNDGIDFRVEVTSGTLAAGPAPADAVFHSVPQVDGRAVWASLQQDSAGLRQLCGQPLRQGVPLTIVDEAFSLVTGTPLRFDSASLFTYTDEIPGIGRNRFFYVVRSVDTAGNRSAWSPASIPFNQVDTSAPEPPQLSAHGGDRAVVLRWPLAASDVVAFRLYRADAAEALENVRGQQPYRDITVVPPDASLTADVSSGTFQWTDTFGPLESTSREVAYRMMAIRRQRLGPDAQVHIESLPGPVATATVLDLTPPEPPQWLRVRWIDDLTGSDVTDTTEVLAIDLGWQTETPQARCTLQRRAGDGSTWFNVVELEQAAVDAGGGQYRFAYRDRAVTHGIDYHYRIVIRTPAGNTNQTFDTHTLAALETL